MVNLNITPTLYTQRKNKKGQSQIRIRTTVKGQVTYYPIGTSVLPEQFVNKEVVDHPKKSQINASIRAKMVEIESMYADGAEHPKKKTDFITFAENKITQQKSKDSLGTWKHKTSYLNKIREYKPDLQFSQINPSLLLDFENYCRSLGNKPTTVWSSVKFIKTMINAALNDGIINKNPMKGYKAQPYVNPVREYLTENEIDSIEKPSTIKYQTNFFYEQNLPSLICYSSNCDLRSKRNIPK